MTPDELRALVAKAQDGDWSALHSCVNALPALLDQIDAMREAAFVLRDLVGKDCIVDGDAWNRRAKAIQVIDAARAKVKMP